MSSYLELLKNIEIFRKLSLLEINLLSALCEEREYSKGKELVKQGEPNETLFLIQRGSMCISKAMHGSTAEITYIGPGESFGEMSLIDEFPASASAVVEEDVCVLVITKADFQSFINNRKDVGLKVYQNICQVLTRRLRIMDEQLAAAATGKLAPAKKTA